MTKTLEKSSDSYSDTTVTLVEHADGKLQSRVQRGKALMKKYLKKLTPKEKQAMEEMRSDPRWKDATAFEEKTFHDNFVAPRKPVNLFWTILFWINFIVLVVLFILVKPFEDTNALKFPLKDTIYLGIVAGVIAVVYNVFMFLILWFFPSPFIRFAITAIFIILCAILIPIVIIFGIFFIIAVSVALLIIVIFICAVCGKIDFSASLLKMAVTILYRFPSVFIFNTIVLIVQTIVGYAFTMGIVLVYSKGFSYYVYIYVVIGYFWISKTLIFVSYNTFAGVASAWYFLNDTEYIPKHPIIYSLAHALTSGFGPCALAGFIDGIAAAFKWISKKGQALACGPQCCCFCLFKCCCKCLVCCIKLFTGVISRYSLIYTAMFGTSAREGTVRWTSIQEDDLIQLLLNTSIVNLTFTFYSYVGFIIGAGIGLILGKYYLELDKDYYVFLALTAGFYCQEGFLLVATPASVMSDTLFVGFAECSSRLMTGASELYDLFKSKYQDEIRDEVLRQEKAKKSSNENKDCCCLC